MAGGRRKGREILLRVLYECSISGEDPLEALEFAFGRYRLSEDGRDHAVVLLRLWISRGSEIDAVIRENLANWDMDRLSPMVRSVLRLCTAEFLGAPEVPARVILDQGVELAKKYGEEGSDGFVNGVLDSVGRRLRGKELQA